jgi:general stress protein 26
MKKKFALTVYCLLVISFTLPSALCAQSSINRDTVLTAAHEMIKEIPFCGLVTIDSTGIPHLRTMNPFPANAEFITWFATSRSSRKVREIKNNPRVCVYYADLTSAKGYVSITGIAEVVDDKNLLLKMKRDYWEGIPNWQNNFVLIKVVPKTMEVINYKHGLNNDPVTFKAPSITF